jgi:hypothetical protein
MKIGDIYIDYSFRHFIDLNKFPTFEPLFYSNLRGKVKSSKEITYKEQHSKFTTPLEIEKESFEKYSVFGHKITTCDFEYDSHGQKVKCYFPSTKMTSEYKHLYDAHDNCTETKCFENGALVSVLKFRFHNDQLKEETITKMEGNKTTFQSRIEYDYLNGQLVEKKRFETKEKSMALRSSDHYWYDENKKLVKESLWWVSSEPWGTQEHGTSKRFYYDNVGRLVQMISGSSIDFIYSKTGHLFQIQNHDRLIEFDEKGNTISDDGKNRDSLHIGFSYEYDSFGNWTKRTERRVTLVPSEEERNMDDGDIINMNAPRLIVTERKIEYYQ